MNLVIEGEIENEILELLVALNLSFVYWFLFLVFLTSLWVRESICI